jgi:hypothetical protein
LPLERFEVRLFEPRKPQEQLGDDVIAEVAHPFAKFGVARRGFALDLDRVREQFFRALYRPGRVPFHIEAFIPAGLRQG